MCVCAWCVVCVHVCVFLLSSIIGLIIIILRVLQNSASFIMWILIFLSCSNCHKVCCLVPPDHMYMSTVKLIEGMCAGNSACELG